MQFMLRQTRGSGSAYSRTQTDNLIAINFFDELEGRVGEGKSPHSQWSMYIEDRAEVCVVVIH